MKGKKILLIGPAHPYRGGLATFNERFVREMLKENEVNIATFTLQYPGFLFPGESQYTDEAKPADLRISREISSINPFNWIAKGLKFRKEKYDLIIFRYWMPFFGPCFGTIAGLAKGNKHTRVVAITDNVIPHERRFYDTAFTKYFLHRIDGAVTMSRKVLQDLDSFRFEKPHVFNPHPLYDNFGPIIPRQDARVKLGLEENTQYILFFGFIRAYKGLDLLLEAMGELRHTGIKLIVAGEFYEDSKPYLEIIEKHGLQENVMMHTHFIPNADVAQYFSACDLVVQPYRNATQSGVSQVAYHFEKPMIVTDVGGLAEFVPHGEVGYVCAPKPSEIARYILEFFTGDLHRFDQGLKNMKEKFSWKELVGSISKVAGFN